MGRYYNGDIEGKFWFAVQSSEAPAQFGGYMELSFSFTEEDLEQVQERIKEIEDFLGENKEKLDQCFEKNPYYNDQTLIDYGFKKEEIGKLIENYADLILGKKIEKCIIETGECNFYGEL